MKLNNKYGDFKSVTELNKKAAELKADIKALKELAKENGLDAEDAQDYADDYVDELATPISAAVGRLDVESNYLNLGGVLIDWVDEIKAECTINRDYCAAVMKKDVAGYIAALADDGYKNRVVVAKEIVKKVPEIEKMLHGHEFSIGVPSKATRYKLMEQYYLG